MPSLEFHILAKPYTLTDIYRNSDQVTLLQQGINDSSWLGWTFSVWRAERKGRNNTTHTSLWCLRKTGTSHISNYMTWLLCKQTKQTKSTRKHMLKSPPTALSSPSVPVFALAMCQTLKLHHQMQKNKARSWKRRMQQKNITKSPDESFWTTFSTIKRTQLGSVTPGNT